MRIGGTSMAAPMVAGAIALMLEEDPSLTPNEVKGAILETTRSIRAAGDELEVDDAVDEGDDSTANKGLDAEHVVNATTGEIDYTRSRWSRSRWSEASAGKLGAEWARSRWSCDCSSSSGSGSVEEQRSRWSRSRWSWNPDPVAPLLPRTLGPAWPGRGPKLPPKNATRSTLPHSSTSPPPLAARLGGPEPFRG